MTYTTNTTTYRRICSGLYVDSTDTWVITNEGRNYWEIRAITEWGPDLSGNMIPDYTSTVYGDYETFQECKAEVARMNADGFVPSIFRG